MNSQFCFQFRFLQKVLLYHNALSEGVEVKDVLSYVRRTKAKNDTLQISELKAQVLRQEEAIQQLLSGMKAAQGLPQNATPAPSHSAAAAVTSAGVALHEPIIFSSGRSELELVETVVSGRHLPPTHRTKRAPVASPRGANFMPIPPLRMALLSGDSGEVLEERGPVSILRSSGGSSRNNSPKGHGIGSGDSSPSGVSGRTDNVVPFSDNGSRDGQALANKTVNGSVPVNSSADNNNTVVEVEASAKWQFTQPVNLPPR